MASSAVPNKLSEVTNQFTAAVYKEIIKNESENIAFSPLSIEVTLCLMHYGAEGISATELATTLHLFGNKEEMQNDAKDLVHGGYFNLMNLFFVQENLTLKEPFLQVAVNHFGVDINHVDFCKIPELRQTILEAVERNTDDWFCNSIGATSRFTLTNLVLSNFLSATLHWASPLFPSSTKTGIFFVPGKTIRVTYLQQEIRGCKYYESTDFKAKFLALPTDFNRLETIFVLPTERNGLSYLEQRIDGIALLKIPFESTPMKVSVPKFRFEYQIDFKKILPQLGVSKIFDPFQADLSGISGRKGDVNVREIVQTVTMIIDEEAVKLNLNWPPANRSEGHVNLLTAPKTFVVDQPFIFFVKAKETIIFAGKVVNPQY